MCLASSISMPLPCRWHVYQNVITQNPDVQYLFVTLFGAARMDDYGLWNRHTEWHSIRRYEVQMVMLPFLDLESWSFSSCPFIDDRRMTGTRTEI